jgi:hypothetical protein
MFWEILPLIAALLTPLWGYLLWRRMKYVQRIANETAKPRERHGVTPVEDAVKTEDGLTVTKSLSYDDDLALATEDANQKSIFKDLEGRKH